MRGFVDVSRETLYTETPKFTSKPGRMALTQSTEWFIARPSSLLNVVCPEGGLAPTAISCRILEENSIVCPWNWRWKFHPLRIEESVYQRWCWQFLVVFFECSAQWFVIFEFYPLFLELWQDIVGVQKSCACGICEVSWDIIALHTWVFVACYGLVSLTDCWPGSCVCISCYLVKIILHPICQHYFVGWSKWVKWKSRSSISCNKFKSAWTKNWIPSFDFNEFDRISKLKRHFLSSGALILNERTSL